MTKKTFLTIMLTLTAMPFTTLTALAEEADETSVSNFMVQSFEEKAAEMQNQFNQQAAANQEWFTQQVADNQAWFNQQVADNHAQFAERNTEMQAQHEANVAAIQTQSEEHRADMQVQNEVNVAETQPQPVQRSTKNQMLNDRQTVDNQPDNQETSNVTQSENNNATQMQSDYESRVAGMQSEHENRAAEMRSDHERSRQNNMNFYIVGAIAIIVIRIIAAVAKTRRSNVNQHSSGKFGIGYAGAPAYDNTHNDFMVQEQNRLFVEQSQRDAQQAIDAMNMHQQTVDMNEATRFSMNSSYNAMSDANFATTGIDSFGHNLF